MDQTPKITVAHVEGESSPMRAIVQTGSHELDNLGDRAMLEVMIDRIRQRHRGAHFSVFARDAGKVRSLGRGVQHVPVEQKREWALLRACYLGARRVLPSADWFLRKRRPWLYNSVLQMKARALVNGEVLQEADILLVSGGGFITDVFPGQAWPVLERLHAAMRQNIPFALLGQGVGPLRDSKLVQKAREVLPHAKLIAVRESLHSLPLLLELGVSPQRIVVTGDDAIEPAYRARREAFGDGLGVNFRVAEYARMTQADVDSLRAPLHSIATKLSAQLVSLPVCIVDSVESASDATVASHLLDAQGKPPADDVPSTPAELMDRIGECRVVVTGSYHAAVFALAQGIPVVSVFNSEYYEMKFRGLANQFGAGCDVVGKANGGFGVALATAIVRAWDRADDLRPALLVAAVRQIADGRHAYDCLSAIISAEVISSHKPSRGLVA